MAAPLVLTFKTEKPVYRLALTATAGAETEILIYTLSETKLISSRRINSRKESDTLLVRNGMDGLEPAPYDERCRETKWVW